MIILIFFTGCFKTPKVLYPDMPHTYLIERDFSYLPYWDKEDYSSALVSFVDSCRSKKTKKLYNKLCKKALDVKNPQLFFQDNFTPFEINTNKHENIGLLTGYYEPQLHGSLKKTSVYKYPIYETPDDLVTVSLGSIYPKLKEYRLRGRVVGKKLIPYYTRSQKDKIKSNIICYVDNEIDLFFLEIQGSGRVVLDDNKTLFVSYDNQNGYRYRAIGRYLIDIGAIKKEDISLQSIRIWLEKNPDRVQEVLNYNKSLVFFTKSETQATGALGIELTQNRSVAVDKKYIPLGAMLYIDATINKKKFDTIVMAQDTGGAIKGALRADLFVGYGRGALNIAGRLKSPLKLWIFLPKDEKK
jgi:membrane-bound lytic murein transglycosylase A